MNTGKRAIPPRAWPVVLTLFLLPNPLASAQPHDGPREDTPQLWAMLVGIQQYEESLAFPRCRGAASDAAAMAHWLIDTAGWGPDHVLLLSDRDLPTLGFTDPAGLPAYRPPTKANLEWGTRQWLTGKARPGDVVVVFFAGQAVGLMPRPDEPPGRPPRDYLLPVDARASNVDATGWVLGDAIEELASRGHNSIVCLLDTSPAGRVRSPSLLGVPPHAAPADRIVRGISRWQGVTAWIAADDRPSGQAQNGEGVFTMHLLEALGKRQEPRTLLACLDTLRHEEILRRQGLRTAGGFDPSLSLWPTRAMPGPRRDPPLLQRGHADRVTAISFSADGSRMMTASMDSTLRIWHAESGTLVRIWPFVTNGFTCQAVSGDGQLLVGGGGNGDVRFFDLLRETEKSVAGAIPHIGVLDYVAVLPVPSRSDPVVQRWSTRS